MHFWSHRAPFIMGYFEDAEYSLATGKPSPNPSPAANEIRRQAQDASYVPPKDLSATLLPKKAPLWKKHPTLHRQEADLSEANKENIEPKGDPKCNQQEEERHNAANSRRTEHISPRANNRTTQFYGQRWTDNGDVVSNQKS